MKGMGSHESSKMLSDTWITPIYIINALGEFDLDPCTPEYMPWQTAKYRYTTKEDGLKSDWFGRVWLNPPYGRFIGEWMKKMSLHNNGIAFIFARTETKSFQQYVFGQASSILFLEGRIKFHLPDGSLPKSTGGAPSCLISYGKKNIDALEYCGLPGKHVLINYTPIIVVGCSPTWFSVVRIAANNFGDKELKPIYDMVERIAPDKVANNPNWKAKVRQQIQKVRLTKDLIK